jgi:hypothetical protein
MKFYLLILATFLYLVTPYKSYAQKKNNDGAIIAAAAGAAAIVGLAVAGSIESIKEGMERNMVEWILENKNLSIKKGFELKLVKWEATKKEDLSNVSVIAYKYTEKGKAPIILLNSCSPGWINENGINFQFVGVYEITPEYWAKMLLNYLNLAKKDEVGEIKNIESIPVVDNREKQKSTSIYNLQSVTSRYFEFEDENRDKTKFEFNKLISGDYHIANDFDDNFKIDFNEGNMNLFLNSTKDLIRIKRDFIIDITRAVYFDKLPVKIDKWDNNKF